MPTDESNLILKARDALRDASPVGATPPPVAIRLEKNLPVASGIGGGSSDAAAALARAREVLGSGCRRTTTLTRIGGALGADLPMCLAAKPLIARGTGDELSPVSGFSGAGAGAGQSRRRRLDARCVLPRFSSATTTGCRRCPRHLDFHTLRNWLEITRNDLEDAALSIEPSIGAAKAALMKADAGFARMSGSGATCFGLFETGNVAKRAAAAIRSRHPGWFVAATRSMPSEGDA